MLARLLLALMIALLPLPATAAGPACHQSPPAAVAESHHGHASKPAPIPTDTASADQFCIGCVAPSTLRGPTLGAPLAYPDALRTARVRQGLALASLPPATPPPRSKG
jgi:hypothetical protein